MLIFCGISDNAPGFCLASLEAYSCPRETPNIKCFAQIVNGWIQSTIFSRKLHLRCFAGFWRCLWLSKGFFYYYYCGFHFESFMKFSNLISILFLLIRIHSMQDWAANTRHGVTKKEKEVQSIVGQRKALYRQRSPKWSNFT